MLPLRPALLATALVAANLAHADVPVGAPFTREQQRLIQLSSDTEPDNQGDDLQHFFTFLVMYICR
ncbi:hypothetical protein [Vogesella indigofera]|uniref:hypothetical protein n=1 Tax=Vogesella indigofera TaxID=45465 RepID=UPI00234EC26A|nr:hypothetical protein [Vogesella indigofera]MDC7701370.1 hypothetical protein [Vogesella indigofera]